MTTKQNDMKRRADFIFEAVKKSNAKADLIVNVKQSLSLKANQGQLEEHKVSSTQIFGIRVVKDGKVGTSYSEADNDEALNLMLHQALTNASFNVINEHEKIVDCKTVLRTDDFLLCPVDSTSIDDKIDLVLSLEVGLLKKDKIKSVPYNGVSETISEQYIFSTAGLDAYSKQRNSMAYAYALAEENGKNSMEGFGQLKRLNKDIDPQKIIKEVHQNCLGMLEGKPIASKRYDVIFDKESQGNLFDIFSIIYSGKSAKDGINPFRNKVGTIVADERLCLIDNPLDTNGFAYELFDAEGTATAQTSIIQNGVFETLLHNSMTASHFGLQSTGHATRGAKSTLGVSSHQINILAGYDSESILYTGEYLEITDLTGVHSGANSISGDFSFGASGYLCKEGKRIQTVRGITVAGNFYKMLQNIVSIGDKQYWNWQKSSLMPSIRFADMAVSGE